ncbi:2,3-diketo-L-gulonate reductase, partial [Pasteurella multocida subsp. multocida str. Anand1_buffalo]
WGFWKGSGLSIVLDMIATLLSNGLSVAEVTEEKDDEYCVSQIFIAIEVDRLIDGNTKDEKLNKIMDYVRTAERADPDVAIRLPGHEFTAIRAENKANGIPVDETVWEKLNRYKERICFLVISLRLTKSSILKQSILL